MGKIIDFPKKLEEERILITHDDLDGIGCAVIITKCFPNIQTFFVSYNEVNEITKALAEDEELTGIPIMITDLSVNKEVAKILDKRGNIELFDHHPTAKWLSKYEWALIDTKMSATKLTYNFFSRLFNLQDYAQFVDTVDDYDMWGYDTEPQLLSQDIARLLEILGPERFYLRFVTTSSLELSDTEQMLLELDKSKELNYIKKSIENISLAKDAEGNMFGLIAADRYVNNVAHTILAHYLDIEYVMLVDFRKEKVQLRGRGNVHLGQLAKLADGGGHKKAAGFPLQNSAAQYFLQCGGKCKVTEELTQRIKELENGKSNNR